MISNIDNLQFDGLQGKVLFDQDGHIVRDFSLMDLNPTLREFQPVLTISTLSGTVVNNPRVHLSQDDWPRPDICLFTVCSDSGKIRKILQKKYDSEKF